MFRGILLHLSLQTRVGWQSGGGGGDCLVAIVSSAKFKQFHMCLCMFRGILLHLSLQSGVGRMVAVAVIVVKHC